MAHALIGFKDMSVNSATSNRILSSAESGSYLSEFKGSGRTFVRIPGFLAGSFARALHRTLRDEIQWGLRLSDGQREFGLGAMDYQNCSAKQIRDFAQIAYAAARNGYSFLREEPLLNIDTHSESGGPEALDAFRGFLNSDPFRQAILQATGISFGSVRGVRPMRYLPGHFCGFSRAGIAGDTTFVFSLDLSLRWSVDWGGLLSFRDYGNRIARTYKPHFNSLTIYAASAVRGISVVAPFARSAQYSILGELVGN